MLCTSWFYHRMLPDILPVHHLLYHKHEQRFQLFIHIDCHLTFWLLNFHWSQWSLDHTFNAYKICWSYVQIVQSNRGCKINFWYDFWIDFADKAIFVCKLLWKHCKKKDSSKISCRRMSCVLSFKWLGRNNELSFKSCIMSAQTLMENFCDKHVDYALKMKILIVDFSICMLYAAYIVLFSEDTDILPVCYLLYS